MSKYFVMVFSAVLLWRILGFLIIFLAAYSIPYLGFFPYNDQLALFHAPSWISPLANFDGIHYILISKNGYSQFEQAFFPLYPLFIKIIAPLFSNNPLVAGLVISNVFFTLGVILASKALKIKSGWFIFFLLAFPTSFFFGAVYNEGLFFFLFMFGLYLMNKGKYFLSGFPFFLASLTRLAGFFLIIPAFLAWVTRPKKATAIIPAIASVLGLGGYCYYLWQTTGDPLYFFSSQPAFGANRSTDLILLPQVYWRYLKIFVTANFDFRYFISAVEFAVFNLVFGVLILDLIKIIKVGKKFSFKVVDFDRLGLNLFSLANLILPTLTGTLSSIPRYALLSISFFIYLAEIKEKWIKIILALVFILFHIILLAYFSQGYFIA